jgi:hypothetical protein
VDFKEHMAILNTLAAQLAKQLTAKADCSDEPWTFTTPEEDSYSVHIDRADGAKLYMRMEHSVGYDKNDRVAIGGSLNIGKNRAFVEVRENGKRVGTDEITVALSRGPEAIAKEIMRRLLPEYLRVLAVAQAKVKADAEYEAKKVSNLRQLAKSIGKTLAYTDEQLAERSSFYTDYGTVEASGSTAYLKLNLTIEQAEHILKYLAKE